MSCGGILDERHYVSAIVALLALRLAMILLFNIVEAMSYGIVLEEIYMCLYSFTFVFASIYHITI